MRRRPVHRVSVVIADDQAMVRNGLIAILSTVEEIDIVGVAKDGAGAVALAEYYEADVVLMDLRMPGVDGVDATRTLGASRPQTAVVALTTYADDDSIRAALEAGAAGYLTKDASMRDISSALLAAAGSRRP